jgi:hypothetical protein
MYFTDDEAAQPKKTKKKEKKQLAVGRLVRKAKYEGREEQCQYFW